MDKYIEINVPYKSSLSNYVKGYAASFSSVTSFRCEGIFHNDKKETYFNILITIYFIS